MIDRDASPALRAQFVAAVLAFAGLGVLGAWVGAATLARALHRSAAHVPLVEFRPLYVTGLPIATAFLGLTILALLPKRIVARAPAGGRRIGAAQVVFGMVVCSLLLATLAAPVARSWVAQVMRERGYRACAAPDAERRPPMRWVRDGGRCP